MTSFGRLRIAIELFRRSFLKPLSFALAASLFLLIPQSFAKGPGLTKDEKKFVKENLSLLAPGDPLIPSTEVWNKMAELAARTEDKKIYDKIFAACDKSDGAGSTNCSFIQFNLLRDNPYFTADYVFRAKRAKKYAVYMVNETQDVSYRELEDVVQTGLKQKPKHKSLRKLAKMFEKNNLCNVQQSDSPECKEN